MGGDRSLVEAFLRGLPEDAATRWSREPDLAAQLEQIWAEVARAWGSLALPPDGFMAHLAGHVRDASVAMLREIDAPSLAIAYGCAAGNEKAASAFVTRHDRDIRQALTRCGVPAESADDVRQEVLAKLLGRTGRLCSYAGRGELGVWVRTVAVRQAISWRRSRRDREVPVDALSIAVLGSDLEASFIKDHHHVQMLAAMKATIEALAPPERALLRNRFADDLTLEQLAVVYGVHRASVARRLARLREALSQGVRARLSSELGIEATELELLMGWARSRLELSLGTLLASDEQAP